MKKLSLIILFLFSSAHFAQIKYVPTDYSMIQHAIDDSKDGDIIIVEEGIYTQQINFKGKAITVASRFYLDGYSSHISRTIIDGMFLEDKDSNSLVYFVNGEDTNSILAGFTLQNGKGTRVYYQDSEDYWEGGGAIFLRGSGATIENNILQNNIIEPGINSNIDVAGGAIECVGLPEDKSLLIKQNNFRNNLIAGKVSCGAGIDVFYSYGKVMITCNRIIGNRLRARDSGYGGGICIYGLNKEGIIENNYIIENENISGYARGGGIGIQESFARIRNNIINFNNSQRTNFRAARGGGISVRFYNTVDIVKPYETNTIIENNTVLYNRSSDGGSGISTTDASAEILNNIVRGNKTVSGIQIYKQKYILDASKIKLIVKYSNVEGGFSGEGNIDVDPNFCDSTYFCLSNKNSECIDAGDPSEKYKDVPDPHEISLPRAPAFGTRRNDMGAFGGPHSKWGEMGVITDVEEDELSIIPNKLHLFQNFPNPFNPSTTIKYGIPSNVKRAMKNVKLVVCDLLGREVVTLVNEKQNPGNYEVTWYAGPFPSGIYFYKLTVNNYSISKKLVLLK